MIKYVVQKSTCNILQEGTYKLRKAGQETLVDTCYDTLSHEINVIIFCYVKLGSFTDIM